MGMRPTDLQIIMQVSRDVERIQHLQQQYSRQQQEHLAAYMRKSLIEKREKTEPLTKPEKSGLSQVSRQKERKGKKDNKGKQKKNRSIGGNIDIIA